MQKRFEFIHAFFFHSHSYKIPNQTGACFTGIMFYVRVSFSDAFDLIAKFKSYDFERVPQNESNFALIHEEVWEGYYGGLFTLDQLPIVKACKHPFECDQIDSNYILVWWKMKNPLTGDTSLRRKQYCLVTRSMVANMKKNVFKTTLGCSKYFR